MGERVLRGWLGGPSRKTFLTFYRFQSANFFLIWPPPKINSLDPIKTNVWPLRIFSGPLQKKCVKPSNFFLTKKNNRSPFYVFFLFMAIVILSASVKRFSVSHMRDFFYLTSWTVTQGKTEGELYLSPWNHGRWLSLQKTNEAEYVFIFGEQIKSLSSEQ